jgi:hypothetical protein
MIVAPLLILTAFLESPFTPVPPAEKVQIVGSASKSVCAKNSLRTARHSRAASGESQGVANLPFAMGRRFATLDSYLTHLECLAQPVDLPWWKEIRPGIYRHMTTATNAPPNEIATRAELLERFGFNR